MLGHQEAAVVGRLAWAREQLLRHVRGARPNHFEHLLVEGCVYRAMGAAGGEGVVELLIAEVHLGAREQVAHTFAGGLVVERGDRLAGCDGGRGSNACYFGAGACG